MLKFARAQRVPRQIRQKVVLPTRRLPDPKSAIPKIPKNPHLLTPRQRAPNKLHKRHATRHRKLQQYLLNILTNLG